MSLELTNQQSEAIKQQGDAPLFVFNPQSQSWYVLMAADQYERIRSLLVEDGEFDIRDTYAIQERVAEAEGWNDPLMDEYHDYDKNRKPG